MTTNANGNSVLLQGRLVWSNGSLFTGKQKTDYNSNAPLTNPDGTPIMEYSFGLAIPKADAAGQSTAEYTKIWQALHAEALTLFPSGQLPPDFAMKYKDGDSIDHKGVNFNVREGYAGHFILNCSTRIPVKFFRHEGNNNIMVSEGIKVGDYVNVQLNIKAHPAKGQGKAGLYVSPSCVQLVALGKEIINAPSGDQVFGAVAPTAYAGQVIAPEVGGVMPVVGQPVLAPVQPAVPAMQPAVAPVQPAVAPVQPAVVPNYNVIPQVHQPAITPVAVPVQPVVAPLAHAMPVQPVAVPVQPAVAPLQPAVAPLTPVMPLQPGMMPPQ